MADIRKFVDYNGLKLYDELNKKWTLDQIEKTNWTAEQIKALAMEVLQQYRDAALEYGEIDDVRPYQSYEYFPGNTLNPEAIPSQGVQYVAMDTQIEYQWVFDVDPVTGATLETGKYIAINETTTSEDINELFK